MSNGPITLKPRFDLTGPATAETLEVAPAAAPVESLPLLDQLNRRRALPAGTAPPGRYLELEGDGALWLLPLEREVTHIGRGLAVDVRLSDDRVSRRHAIVARRGSRVRILDDRSANGTFVNGRRVEESELHDGDVVLLGPVVLRYRELSVPASSA